MTSAIGSCLSNSIKAHLLRGARLLLGSSKTKSSGLRERTVAIAILFFLYSFIHNPLELPKENVRRDENKPKGNVKISITLFEIQLGQAVNRLSELW